AEAALHVENCVISRFSNDGIVSASTGQLFLADIIARGNGDDGVHVANGTVAADRCHLEKNGFSGLRVISPAKGSIRKSVASGNTQALYGQDGGELNIDDCLATNNVAGGGGIGIV